MLSEVVEGKRVFAKHYPGQSFHDLTDAQQDAVKRLRREAKKGGHSSDAKTIAEICTEFQDSMSQMEQRIIAGVSRAQQDNAEMEDDLTNDNDDNTINNSRRRSTPSGAVGGFLANQRCRRNGSST